MYHNVLPRGARVCSSQTDQHATKEIMISKLSQTQKDALPQTDAISNKSNKTKNNQPQRNYTTRDLS